MAILKHDLAEFSNVAGAADVTVWHQYKHLYPYLVRTGNNGSINVTPFGTRPLFQK
jgi:hypothetical protein